MDNQFDLGWMRHRRRADPVVEFRRWWKRNHAHFSPAMRYAAAQFAAEQRAQAVGDVGDIWHDIKEKFLTKAGDAVKQLTDQVGKNAPDVAKAAAEYQLIRENIKRINDGRPTINVSEATGFGDVKTMVYAGIGAVVLITLLKRRR